MTGRVWLRRAALVLGALAAAAMPAVNANVAEAQQAKGAAKDAPRSEHDLFGRLTPELIQRLFPGADKVQPTATRPPALEVYVADDLKGYIFSTLDVVNATGYSGKQFDFIAGMATDGKITGVELLKHAETIIGRGVPQARMDQYLAGFASATVTAWRPVNPDLLKGASVSGRLLKSGMQSAAERVFAAHVQGEGLEVVTEPKLDRRGFAPFTGEELVKQGSLTGVKLTIRDVLKLFEAKAGKGAIPSQQMDQAQSLDEVFITYLVALASPASIGANLFGDDRFKTMVQRQGTDGFTIFMASDGYFSFASNSHFSAAQGYMFDQVKVVQGEKEFRFTRDNYQRFSVGASVAGAIPRRDMMVFYLPASSGFEPLQPWQAVLMIPGKNAQGAALTLEVPISYTLPDAHKLLPQPPPKPPYVDIWQQKQVDIYILAALLTVVTLVFVLQDAIARNRVVYNVVRIGILAFTLGWLGWWAGAQFSIINILSYVQAPFTDTGLEAFLLDPLFFILGIYVALTLFLLGRGVFCGWLCPFGALQELSNKLALLARVPQIKVPRAVQERLWAVKYLAAATIIGVGLYSADMANQLEELEPFKTAINVKFARELPFVLYAAALLGAGLFIERFYCRFLCPLGGSLAVFGRIHMFKWLKRKPQCGTQCRICEADCPVGAIEPSGLINMNECLQCLDCQVDYYDDNKCPPLIARKKRKDARAEAGIGVAPGARSPHDGLPSPVPAE